MVVSRLQDYCSVRTCLQQRGWSHDHCRRRSERHYHRQLTNEPQLCPDKLKGKKEQKMESEKKRKKGNRARNRKEEEKEEEKVEQKKRKRKERIYGEVTTDR